MVQWTHHWSKMTSSGDHVTSSQHHVTLKHVTSRTSHVVCSKSRGPRNVRHHVCIIIYKGQVRPIIFNIPRYMLVFTKCIYPYLLGVSSSQIRYKCKLWSLQCTENISLHSNIHSIRNTKHKQGRPCSQRMTIYLRSGGALTSGRTALQWHSSSNNGTFEPQNSLTEL